VQASSRNSRQEVREFKILNRYGIHARPAALFAKTAARFDADIFVEKDGSRVSGKSIMGLMTLEASHGSVVRVIATGHDAAELINAIGDLIAQKFDED
jgi:phosphocarrier protein